MQSKSVTIASYNMSFACGQGKKIGSEKKFIHDSLNRNKFENPQQLFSNSLEHLYSFWNEQKPDFIGLQEINDEDFVKNALGTKTIIGSTFLISEKNMYNQDGTINKEGEGYHIYGIEIERTKPTIIMVWNTKKLGKGKHYYGGELGSDKFEEKTNQKGRLIQMVITDKNFVLINLHGPNSKVESINGMQYLTEKINEFITENLTITIENFSKVFIVGDFNDPYGHYGSHGLELNLFPTIKFRSRKTEAQEKIKSCCYNFDSADFEKNYTNYNNNIFKTGRPGQYNEKNFSLEENTPQNTPQGTSHDCTPYDGLVNPIIQVDEKLIYDVGDNECKQYNFGKNIKRGMLSTYLFEGDYCLGFCVEKNLAIWGRENLNVFSNESDHELVWAKFWSFV